MQPASLRTISIQTPVLDLHDSANVLDLSRAKLLEQESRMAIEKRERELELKRKQRQMEMEIEAMQAETE